MIDCPDNLVRLATLMHQREPIIARGADFQDAGVKRLLKNPLPSGGAKAYRRRF